MTPTIYAITCLEIREIITKNETLSENFLGFLLKVLELDGTSSLGLLDAEKNGSFNAIKISFSMFYNDSNNLCHLMP